MSYDVSFVVHEKYTNSLIFIGDSVNITWNVKELIKQSSGWNIKNEATNGLAKDLIPKLQVGLYKLEHYEGDYKKYESPNGWGTIEGVKRFYKKIIEEWEWLTSECGTYEKVKDYIKIYVD